MKELDIKSGSEVSVNGRDFIAIGLTDEVPVDEFLAKLPDFVQKQLVEDIIGGKDGLSVYDINFKDFPVYYVHGHILENEEEKCVCCLIYYRKGEWGSAHGSTLLDNVMYQLTNIFHIIHSDSKDGKTN